MTLTADETQSTFGSVLIFVALTGAVIYGFGYVRAVMHRANSDYKKTKELLPGMRKTFWSTWWIATKRGTLLLLIVAALVYFWVKTGGSDADANQSPTPSSSPSTHHPRR